jgi:hypoxanthine phosphoribosyltransferase
MIAMKSYEYAHRQGVLSLTWEDFANLSACLAELLEPHHPEIVVGLARAGLFPATAVACSLRCELYPARLTRRLNDQVVRAMPDWLVPVSSAVAGKVVAVVDEMCDSGQTLAMAATMAQELRARQVITASLVSHTWADPAPQVVALVTDAFVIFPWDRQVRIDGAWRNHPEIEAGLQAQGYEPKVLAE